MSVRTLQSRDNPNLKRWAALAHGSHSQRRAQGQTLLDGAHLVLAARAAGVGLDELIVSESGLARAENRRLFEADVRPVRYCLPDALFARISPTDAPTGLLATLALPPPPPPPLPGQSWLVLDRVQDSGNLGTLLRTAAAAGLREVLLSPGCARPWSPRVLRAGMGAHFHLRVHEEQALPDRLNGFAGTVLATGLGQGARPLYALDLQGPVAWLFGSEGQGLDPALGALARWQVIIPMAAGVESLNVAAAAAICLFEQRRQCLVRAAGAEPGGPGF